MLHEVFEYPCAEIALMIGLSAPNCRQLCHRTQRHLAITRGRFTPMPEAHQRMVNRFVAATQQGDLMGLTTLLANDLMN